MRTKQGTEITIGCDPEFFLYDIDLKQFVSAHEMIPGDKKNPFKVDNGAIQVDGTAVEFNIDAASTAQEFEGNINSVLSYLRKTIPDKYEFKFSPAIHYNKKYFDALPKSTKELGCDPDFNAYTSATNPRPPADKVGTMRTGSGHIHIGWTKDADIKDPSHVWDCETLVKHLDSWFFWYSHFWDDDTERQKLYGMKGSYRPKPYGVEYRVPSNAWLAHPQLYQWLFKSVVDVFELTERGYNLTNLSLGPIASLEINWDYAKATNHESKFDRFIRSFYPILSGTAPKLPEIKGWTPAFTRRTIKVQRNMW